MRIKNMENKKTYSGDHVLAMFEEIKSQSKVVIEQYDDLTKKVDLILEDIDGLKSGNVDIKSDIKDIKVELIEMNGKLDSKAKKEVVDKHETRIVKLEKTALANG
jgi:uncharacterized protein YoxC